MKFLKRKSTVAILIILFILLSLFVFAAIYVSDYYEASNEEIEAFLPKKSTEVYKDGYITFGDEDSEVGFVFYPGGKVEYTSYIPLMRTLAEKGVFCVLYDMPFNLAVLDVNAADGIEAEYPEIDRWYAGGHSLGGSMIASHISDKDEVYSGLVLLGSYSTADLSGLNISVLSLYGSEDGVMNREKYEENKVNLPSGFTEIIIEGGCHAYFGMYGEQDGDGEPALTPAEQISFTAEKILEHVSLLDG